MTGLATEGITDVTTSVAERIISWGLASIIVGALLLALMFVASIAIAKKAGYSGWWGAIFVLAWPIGWLFLGIFAILKWPALKERDEAFAVLREHDLTIPMQDRRAIREEKRRLAAEQQAQRDLEKAQAARLKAEAERAKLAARGAETAPEAGPAHVADAEAASADGGGDGGS